MQPAPRMHMLGVSWPKADKRLTPGLPARASAEAHPLPCSGLCGLRGLRLIRCLAPKTKD